MKLQIVGGGKMGQALLGGLIDTFAAAGELAVVEPNANARSQVASSFPGVGVSESPLPDVAAVLAVKPYLAIEVASSLPSVPRLLSICAGITTSALEAVTSAAVVRCMPNTPALEGMGASAVAVGASGDADDLDWGLAVLGAVGVAVAVTEPQIDAVTGLSGSGPAYIFLVAEAMTDAGVRYGLPRPIAAKLAINTINGSGRLMTEIGRAHV